MVSSLSKDQVKFMTRVRVDGECWAWNGSMDRDGYGRFWFEGRYRLAHRFAYWAWNGPLEEDRVIDHICRNRACVRPEHLRSVTYRENALHGDSPCAINARKTHCPLGHPLDRMWGKQRYCSTCHKAKTKRIRKARRERPDPMAHGKIHTSPG